MSFLLFLYFLLPLKLDTSNTAPDLAKVRTSFYEANKNKASAVECSKMLSAIDTKSPPILICYKGASEMIQAKYAFNPINKFKRFRNGKSLIEQAIHRDAKDLEMRFLRFSIQCNLPSFLGYNDSINRDKFLLIKTMNEINDQELKQNIIKYMLNSGQCSAEELKGAAK